MSNKTITKAQFKTFAQTLRNLGRLSVTYDGEKASFDEFCTMLGHHDPDLATKARAWAKAGDEMAKQIESRSEGTELAKVKFEIMSR